MRDAVARVGKTAGFLAVGACPLFIHAALATGRWMVPAAILGALQVLILGVIMLGRSAPRYKWWVAAGAAALAVMIYRSSAEYRLLATSGVGHAVIYSGLLGIFGTSLLSGREALLTTFVRKVHGPLSAQLVAYTRGVTWAWCFFFAGQLVGSLALFLCAPVVVWSFFVNVLNYPLVVLMFACELGYRSLHIRNRPRSRFSDIILALTHRNSVASTRADPGRPTP